MLGKSFIPMQQPRPLRQTGSVLIVSLIMLILLTLITVSSMGGATLQERMAANAHIATITFAAAQSGLREGEGFIGDPNLRQETKPTAKPRADCIDQSVPCALWAATSTPNTGPWDTGGAGLTRYRSWTWWETNGRESNDALEKVTAQPRYIIEDLGTVSISNSLVASTNASDFQSYYRITSFSVGQSPNTPTIVQSIYGRVF